MIQLIASFALVAVLVIASEESVRTELGWAGTFAVVFGAMFGLMRPLKALTNVTGQFQRGMAACNSLFHLMDLETEKDLGQHKTEQTVLH